MLQAGFPRLNGHSRGISKLDRLNWAEGIAVIAYGVRLGIRANQPGVIAQYLPALPPAWELARSPRVERLYSIIAGGQSPRRSQLCRRPVGIHARGSKGGCIYTWFGCVLGFPRRERIVCRLRVYKPGLIKLTRTSKRLIRC